MGVPGREAETRLTSPPLLAFQSERDPPVWTCPFRPPLQLRFVVRNPRRHPDFRLAKVKVVNYWTEDGVSNGSGSSQAPGGGSVVT